MPTNSSPPTTDVVLARTPCRPLSGDEPGLSRVCAPRGHLQNLVQHKGQGSATVPSLRHGPTIGAAIELDPERRVAVATVVTEAAAAASERCR